MKIIRWFGIYGNRNERNLENIHLTSANPLYSFDDDIDKVMSAKENWNWNKNKFKMHWPIKNSIFININRKKLFRMCRSYLFVRVNMQKVIRHEYFTILCIRFHFGFDDVSRGSTNTWNWREATTIMCSFCTRL